MSIVFLLITAPVAAHMIARAAYRTGVPLWHHTVIDELRDATLHAERSPAPPRADPDV